MANNFLGVFDAQNTIVQITFQGLVTRITGFGDGDYVSVDPASEDATIQTGADGLHVANYTANTGANIRLTLQAQSESNRFLRQLRDLRAQFQITVASPDTKESGFSPCAIIQDRPDVAFGAEAGTRVWSIFGGDWIDGSTVFSGIT